MRSDHDIVGVAPRWKTPETVVLLCVLAVAIFFRGYPNNAGLHGVVFPRNDELNYSPRVVDCLRGDWRMDWFRNPSLYIYGTAGATWLVGEALVIMGTFERFSEFAFSEALNPYRVTIVGRCISIAAGVLSVAVLYMIVRRWFSARAAAIAALALAVNRVHCQRSPLLGNEVAMVLLVLLFFLLLLRFIDSFDVHTFVLCGFVLGLATSTKYNAGIHVITMVAGVLIAVFGVRRGSWRHLVSRRVVLGFIAIPIGFLAASPMILVDFQDFAEQFRSQGSILHGGWLPVDRQANQSQWTYYIREFPRENNGLLLALLSAAGCAAAVARSFAKGDFRLALVLVASLPTYLVLGSGIFGVMRFLLPAVPFVLILGAVMLDWCLASGGRRLRSEEKTTSPAANAFLVVLAVVVVAAVLGPHGISTHRVLARQYGNVDPRQAIVSWMRSNLDTDENYVLLAKPPSYRVLDRRQTLSRFSIDEAGAGSPVEQRLLLDFRRSTFNYLQLESFIEQSATLDDLRASLAESGAAQMVFILDRSLWNNIEQMPLLTRSHPLQDCGYWQELLAMIDGWEAEQVQVGGLVLAVYDIPGPVSST